MKRWNQEMVPRDKVSISGEIDHIIGKAREHDSRVVRLGPLLFFSTETGDAWMLDPDGRLALCLAIGGARQEFTVCETAGSFEIGWKEKFKIEGEIFTVSSPDGRARSLFGYPTAEIVRSARHKPGRP